MIETAERTRPRKCSAQPKFRRSLKEEFEQVAEGRYGASALLVHGGRNPRAPFRSLALCGLLREPAL